MDRNRDGRRISLTAATNGLSRRRHRASNLRDSREEDVQVDLQEMDRLRDRGGSGKKDRDRDRERERERDRERERERLSSRGKRRKRDRLIHGINREDGDDSSEESVNHDEDEDEDDRRPSSSMRMLPPNNSLMSSPSFSTHQHQNNHISPHLHHQRKSYPLHAKVFKPAPPTSVSSTWRPADEMIGVSVPRKARSASIKRAHEYWLSAAGGGVLGGEQISRQTSASPVRASAASLLTSPSPAPAPASPSSSNASAKKKLKPNGPKHKSSISSSKPASSQDEIEIEIAEVLYGMMRQPQGQSKQEIIGNDPSKLDSREGNSNKPVSDAKSRASSPISNSHYTVPQSSSIPVANSSSSNTSMPAIVPKRKRPRPAKHEDENLPVLPSHDGSILSTTKEEIDQPSKIEGCLVNLEKDSGSTSQIGDVSYDLLNSQAVTPQLPAPTETEQSEAVNSENNPSSHLKNFIRDNGDLGVAKEEAQSPKKDSLYGLKLGDDHDNFTPIKANSVVVELENNKRGEKFQIDLMAPPQPPPGRKSPDRETEVERMGGSPKPMPQNVETELELKTTVKEDENTGKYVGKETVNLEPQVKKAKTVMEEMEPLKSSINIEKTVDLQLNVDKFDKGNCPDKVSDQTADAQVKQQQQQHQPVEKAAQTSSLSMPMSLHSWPGLLPPMGYMAPLQGVVSMDGNPLSSAPVQPAQLVVNQTRPKRCATHCYIARNIHCHQQFTKVNPFWPAAPGSAPLYGAKACNVNVVPPMDMHGNISCRGVNSLQDKGQSLAFHPGHLGKEKSSQSTNIVDGGTQRKQILLQQALPPGAASNILHGPALIFPMGQQHAAAAASVRPGSVKSPPATGGAAPLSMSNHASLGSTAAATAMSFNYPNMAGNEAQYLAILQNNGYPFPIPAHVGAPPPYRGSHAQPMPFINGSFYPSQMLYPSHLQQQQPSTHAHHVQQGQQSSNIHSHQGHQNTSISGGSSSSTKNKQNQQQRAHGSTLNGGNSVSLQSFPASRNQSTQSVQRQQQNNQHASHQSRQLENETGTEDSPSTAADSRVNRANVNMYGQNFAMPLQPANFALMTTAPSPSGNHGEKKQQQGPKAGVEPLTSQAFAMSFAPLNNTASGFDISSMAQNHAILKSLPESALQGYQIMAAACAAQAAQQKKNYRLPEDGKAGAINDASNADEERKGLPGKSPVTLGQSIAFSRPDLMETSVSTMPGSATDGSAPRTLNLGSAPTRTSGTMTLNSPGSHQQLQQNQQLQQLHQRQKQYQFAAAAAAAAQSKPVATSNGTVHPDHLASSSMPAKFPNALSAFPQNVTHSSNSPVQTPSWKNSVRPATSQVSSPSPPSSTLSSHKGLPHQQGRPQSHTQQTQISFGANPKLSTTTPQGQQFPSNQSQSPPVVAGSPSNSSMSKSAGGSPRAVPPTSTGNKSGQTTSTLSSQQIKNSTSAPSRKLVGGRNAPSVLGNAHVTSTQSIGAKSQLPQQQQQQHQHLPKHALQQAQLFFSGAYMQPQAQHSTSTAANASSGFYLQRHRNDQQQQQQQPTPGLSSTSSTGMLSLCNPVMLSNTTTSDPAKAIAAAAAAAASAASNNMKGGGGGLPLPTQGNVHAASFGTTQSSGKTQQQLMPATFPYVSTTVQVKPAEQKQQPAGE